MGGRWIVVGVLIGVLVPSGAGAARLGVTASRSELLYSSGAANPNCSELSKITDDSALPLYIVRLHAAAPPGIPADQVRYEWSFPKPALGVLAADIDLGPDEEEPAIRSLCADLGNGCVLTAEQLTVYNHPSILWIAPGCNVLPDNTARPFHGGRVRIGARASVGKRRLGKGAVTIGFGRLGSLVLFVKPALAKHFDDGIGKPGGVGITLDPDFAVRFDAGSAPLPALEGFTLDSGGGGTVPLSSPCLLDTTFTACESGRVLYTSAGKRVGTAMANFKDGSVFCDKLTVNVLTAPLKPTLDVSISPKRRQYVPGDPTSGSVNLRVRLRNASPPGPLNNILVLGNAATCDSEVRVGASTISKTTQIDLQHCSATVHQGCDTDADCTPGPCRDCQPNEVCITSSYCSTFPGGSSIGCTSDRDCQPPRCMFCGPNDTCIHVLPLSSIFLAPGDTVDLVNSTIGVANTLSTPARVTDTWTGHTFNAGDASDVVKYRIAPRPNVKP